MEAIDHTQIPAVGEIDDTVHFTDHVNDPQAIAAIDDQDNAVVDAQNSALHTLVEFEAGLEGYEIAWINGSGIGVIDNPLRGIYKVVWRRGYKETLADAGEYERKNKHKALKCAQDIQELSRKFSVRINADSDATGSDDQVQKMATGLSEIKMHSTASMASHDKKAVIREGCDGVLPLIPCRARVHNARQVRQDIEDVPQITRPVPAHMNNSSKVISRPDDGLGSTSNNRSNGNPYADFIFNDTVLEDGLPRRALPAVLAPGTTNTLERRSPRHKPRIIKGPTGRKQRRTVPANEEPATSLGDKAVTRSSSNLVASMLDTVNDSICDLLAGTNIKGIEKDVAVFELTPLSVLIEQSFQDLKIMKRMATAQQSGATIAIKLNGGVDMVGTDGTTIDYEKAHKNLADFQLVYKNWLANSSRGIEGGLGEPEAEVHLVAQIRKRSEVVKGTMTRADSMPVTKVTDLGL